MGVRFLWQPATVLLNHQLALFELVNKVSLSLSLSLSLSRSYKVGHEYYKCMTS